MLVGNLKKKYAQELLAEKLPQQDNTTTTDSEMEEPYLQGSARPPQNDFLAKQGTVEPHPLPHHLPNLGVPHG